MTPSEKTCKTGRLIELAPDCPLGSCDESGVGCLTGYMLLWSLVWE